MPSISEWSPTFVLPNMILDAPIESSEFCLANLDDPRVIELCSIHQTLSRFLLGFTDHFNKRCDPSIILARKAFGEKIEVGNISDFRNAISICFVAMSGAWQTDDTMPGYARWSNYFDFYPWTIGIDYEHLVQNTITLHGLQETDYFRGSTSAEVPHQKFQIFSFDKALFARIMDFCSNNKNENPNQSWKNLALSRSLNMAYHASRLPGGPDAGFYDIGRLLALWVSAFEILAHPGGNQIVNLDKVLNLLEKTPWLSQNILNSSFNTHLTGDRREEDNKYKIGPCFIYKEIYRLRNDFLHGNPIYENKEHMLRPRRNILKIVPSLYRAALCSFLEHRYVEILPDNNDESAWHAHFEETKNVKNPQLLTERYICDFLGISLGEDLVTI